MCFMQLLDFYYVPEFNDKLMYFKIKNKKLMFVEHLLHFMAKE